MARYFTLAVRNERDRLRWGVHFGSYDKTEVLDERRDCNYSGTYQMKDMRIVESEDTQAAIDEAVKYIV